MIVSEMFSHCRQWADCVRANVAFLRANTAHLLYMVHVDVQATVGYARTLLPPHFFCARLSREQTAARARVVGKQVTANTLRK